MEGAREPGSAGEHLLQERYGSRDRAQRFYREQTVDALTPRMREFLVEQTTMTVATAAPDGQPSASPRFGDPGFLVVLDERTVAWPELRGNGVMTSLGNIAENPKVHLLFVDTSVRIGLHLNGCAEILEAAEMAVRYPTVVADAASVRPPERWVLMRLESAYVHCRKHIPRADDEPISWGTDDTRAKGGDYFEAKRQSKPWALTSPEQP